MKIRVKPGGPDRLVPIPGHRPIKFVPEGGMDMELDQYVKRRLLDGDLVRDVDAGADAQAKPASAPPIQTPPTPAPTPAKENSQ